jgi:hypothetical protein
MQACDYTISKYPITYENTAIRIQGKEKWWKGFLWTWNTLNIMFGQLMQTGLSNAL